MTFYTYMWLREDGTPYYVGKGHGARAIRKGSPSLDRILIQEFESEADAFAAEVFLIAHYGRIDNGTGILRNMTDGGDGASNPSAAVRRKIGDAKLGHKHNLGKRHTEETKQKMSVIHLGNKSNLDKTLPEEQRLKMSVARCAYWRSKRLTELETC